MKEDHQNEEDRAEQSVFRETVLQLLAEIAGSLAELVESADFLAAHPEPLSNVDLDAETIRHRQANVDYDWLKSLLHKAHPDFTEGEYITAHGRIARLAGL